MTDTDAATPAPTPSRCLVVLNTAAGSYAANEDVLGGLEEHLESAGLRPDVHRVGPDAIDDTLAEHLADEPTLVVAGGGDGTVQSVARRLCGTDHTLGLLPLGTMNRFATTLGLPSAVPEAIEVLGGGHDRPIDLAQVNDRLFLSTCMLGVYPELARRREARRERHRGWPNFLRWLVDTLTAARFVLSRWRQLRFRLRVDGEPVGGKLAALLVTNNAAAPLGPRTVAATDLGLYIPRVATPLRLFWLAVSAILRGPRALEPLEVRTMDEAVLSLPPGVPVALDAEVTDISPPLYLRVRPRAVWVRTAPPDSSPPRPSPPDEDPR